MVKTMKRRKKRKVKKVYGFLLLVIILLILGVIIKDNKFNDGIDKLKEVLMISNIRKLEIIDEDSDSRSIAVMINNHESSRPYHTGLQQAYLVYEIIVEGGYTRYMALYKDINLEKIGSIRSARHYFLDYALENDAIYVHWGWSPEAEEDIGNLNIDNINGLTHEQDYFFRDNFLNIGYEHRGFTSTELIDKAIDRFDYRDVSDDKILLSYTTEEVNLSTMDNSLVANEVVIPYSGIITTSYKYDSDKMVYLRYVNGVEHKDYSSGEQYSFKNIITYQVSNYTLTGDVKGRQDIDNIGSGTGYYITNGYAVLINWKKDSRSSKTIYTYMDGTEIQVNDGNTFIQIQPKSKSLTIK